MLEAKNQQMIKPSQKIYLFKNKFKQDSFIFTSLGKVIYPESGDSLNTSIDPIKSLSKTSIKINKKDIQTIQIEVEFAEFELTIENSDCVFPFVFFSKDLISVRRENQGHLRISMGSSTTFATTFLGKNAFYSEKSLKILNKTSIKFKYLHFVCPFYSTEQMQTSISFQFQNSESAFNLGKTIETSVQFYTTLRVEEFLDNALGSDGVIKAALDDILMKEGSTNYKIDFSENDKYLLSLSAPDVQFTITCATKIKFWVIKKRGQSEVSSVMKENSNDILLRFSPEEEENGDEFVLFLYVEKAILDQKSVDLVFLVHEDQNKIKSFFDQNWTFIIIFCLVLVIIFLLFYFKKRSIKRKKKEAIKKEKEKAVAELLKKRQEKTRKMSIFLKNNLHKLDRKN